MKKPTDEELRNRVKELEEEKDNYKNAKNALSNAKGSLETKADAMSSEKYQINVSGINIEWDMKTGSCTFEGLPVSMMWIDTTLSGLMSGVQSMVGTSRFALALQSEGRKSVEADWQVISQFPDFQEGFNAIANIAAVAGWGDWKLISINEIKKKCVFRIWNSWEGRYHKSLGVNWGSGMLAGKLAGYCSKLYGTNCWAEQKSWIAMGDEYDEFVITPSDRSIEKEIGDLLATDEATRADMAVAMQKLEKEITERKKVDLYTSRLNILKEKLLGSGSLYEKLSLITDECVGLFGADFARIWVISPGDLCELDCIHAKKTKGPHVCRDREKCLHLRSSSGRYTHLDGELHRRVPFDCYKIGRIASGEIPKFLTNDITSDQMLHNRKWAKELGLVSFAGYQLLSSGGIPAGVLAIFKKTTISPEDDLYLQNIANTTAQVIQQMETERALQESEEKYRTLTENLNAGIYRSTPDSKGRFLAASHAVVKMFGFESIEEFLSINVSDVYNNPGERPGFIQKVSEKGLVKDHEIEFKRKDGTVFIGSDTSVAVKNKQGTLLYLDGIIEDITERKRTESVQKVLYNILNAALKTDTLNTLLEIVHSEINTLMDAKNFYVALYNEKTGMYTFPYFADEFDEFDAYETVKLGKGFTEFVRKNNKSLLIDKVSGKELIKAGEVSLMGKRAESWMGVPLKSYEESIGVVAVQSYKKPDVYTEQDLKILTYVSGHIAMAIERKQAEEALVRTRFSIEQSIDPIYWIDSKGNILDINNAACTNLGYSKEELLSMRVFDLGSEFPPEIWKEHFEVLKKKKNLLFEATHIRKNGIELPVEINSTYVKFDEQELVCSFARNITERKQSEEEKKKLLEQLFHAQKMESIGRLAGGIAHDFNNILVGIKGFAELLKLKFDDRSTSEGKAADVIMKGSERAADLTKQLLGFARGGKYNPVPLNLNDVIRNNVKVSEKIFEKNIKVKYDFDENINNVEADKNQIDQVLTNLIINAKDAMPKGGDLIFKTENIYADEKFKRQNPYFNLGHYVKISITDTGTGMSKRVKENIFDPFFTTKGEGKGTGLGLATVYGIVKNHDGQISVYSEPDKGTTFILYFPVSEKKILEAPEVMEIIKGEATILVVDDEEHVRELSVDMLKELGYKTLLAKDGKEAVSIFKKRKDEIDLVLLDMIMPEMAGRETNLRLKSINPDVRVLLMSGYSQNGTAAEILDEGVLGFIQKPFGMGELSAAIAKVLKTLK